MAAYYANELMLDLPDEFKDKTHHIFSLVDQGPSPFNLVMSRNPADDGETLESYGVRLIKELELALPQFTFLSQKKTKAGSETGLELTYTWLNNGILMRQVQVSFFHTLAGQKRQVIQLTATLGDGQSEMWDEVFRGIIGSVRLRVAQPMLASREPFEQDSKMR